MTRTTMYRLFVVVSILALSAFAADRSFARPVASDVTLTGLVTCAHCVGNQPLHKTYTPWSWALYSVSQGDGFVIVVSDKTYKLQGDKALLTKYVADKATVSGHLDGNTIQVTSIVTPAKAE